MRKLSYCCVRLWQNAAVVGIQACLLLQFSDLISNKSSTFELELGGGFGHFAFEFPDDFGDNKVAPTTFAEHAFFEFARFAEAVQGLLHSALDRLRGDAVLRVMIELHLAAIVTDAEQGFDALRFDVGKEHDLACDVSRGATGGLDE